MVELKCDICSKTFKRKQCKIKRAKKHYCSNACRYKGQEAPKRESWVEYGIVYLKLTNGKVVLFDEVDRDLVIKNWQPTGRYVSKKDNDRKHIYMHRIILERMLGRPLKDNEIADHINSDGFDNRRENIRALTQDENSTNAMKPARSNTKKKSTSRYKGVSFDKGLGRWRARITCGGITHHIGYFGDETDAAKAYDKAAIAFFGDYAKLNFPNEWYAWNIHRKNKCAYKAEA